MNNLIFRCPTYSNDICLSKVSTQKSESQPGIAGHANCRPSSVFPAGNNFPEPYGPPGPFLDPDLRFPRTFSDHETRPSGISPDARPITFRARDKLRIIDLPPFSHLLFN